MSPPAMIQVETRDGVTSFRPGDDVSGRAWWQLDRQPEEVVARLFWYTRGKGTQDVVVVQEETFPAPGAQDQRKFSFRLPEGPFSFSGSLISLIWAVEVVAMPGEESGRVELVVSPTGDEIRVMPVEAPGA
jgi:hypothetical protein